MVDKPEIVSSGKVNRVLTELGLITVMTVGIAAAVIPRRRYNINLRSEG
jgi:hypothetical protein